MFGLGQLGKLGSVGRAIAAWTPAKLWPLGAASPGCWIDPPYVASEYLESTGVTPLSTIGTVLDTSNPVGLVLDRKGNLELGSQLATNGDFSDGTTGWTSVTIASSVSGGVLTLIGGTGFFYQAYSTVVGRTYKVQGNILQIGTAFTAIRKSDDSGVSVNVVTFLSAVGGADAVFVATATTTYIVLQHNFSAVDGKFSAISVKEIPGIHLSQATATSRPVASARKNELLATAVLSTQNVTTTAIPYTISFAGAGTIVATGTYVGALTNGQTFTPTAGTLTLTVAGSVTTAQLERGSVVTTYQRVGATASDYDASAGPTYCDLDGTDDGWLSATFTADTDFTAGMDALIAVRRDSTANAVCGLYESVAEANKVFGIAESGSGSGCVGSGAGTPTVWVDDVQLAGGTAVTRGTLHTALTPGAWHILEFRNLDLSTWTAIGFGLYTGYRLNGGYGGHKVFSNGQDANRDLARAAMADYFGVTLP